MKRGWQTKKLGEICEVLKRGISPKYLESGGICVLNQKCIRNHAVSFRSSRRHNINAKKVPNERFIQLGDVLVNSTGTGTLGRVAQIRELPSEQTTVDSHVTIVRPNKDLFHLDFFGYAMISIEEEIKNAGEGCGGQTELARSTLAERFLVRFPETKTEQKRIVALLDDAFEAIDISIENTKKNLQNSRELFQSYLNDIFLKESQDWQPTTLGKIYDVRDGTHDSPKYQESGPPLITSKNLKSGGLSFEKVNFISQTDFENINKRSAVSRGDVLFAMIGTIGNPTLVEIEPNFAIKNVALFKVPENQNSLFLKYYLESARVIRKMHLEAKGTTQKFVGLGYLRQFPVRIPSLSMQNQIVKKLGGIESETHRLESIYQKKIAALEELKKSLLHQAFSGEL